MKYIALATFMVLCASTNVTFAQPAKEKYVLEGHAGEITSLAFSPDGKWLASGSRDKTVRIWEMATGDEIFVFKGHAGPVTKLAFSPNSARLASASGYPENLAKVWLARSGQELFDAKGHTNSVNDVAFSPDGHKIATASSDKTARLWDALSGREILSLDAHRGTVYSVAFSHDGKLLATAGGDKMARIWKSTRNEEILSLPHSGAVSKAFFSHDDKNLATIGENADGLGAITIWNTATGNQILAATEKNQSVVRAGAFKPDGKFLVTSFEPVGKTSTRLNNSVKIRSADTLKEFLTLTGDSRRVMAITFSGDGRWFAIAGGDRKIRVWNSGQLCPKL